MFLYKKHGFYFTKHGKRCILLLASRERGDKMTATHQMVPINSALPPDKKEEASKIAAQKGLKLATWIRAVIYDAIEDEKKKS